MQSSVSDDSSTTPTISTISTTSTPIRCENTATQNAPPSTTRLNFPDENVRKRAKHEMVTDKERLAYVLRTLDHMLEMDTSLYDMIEEEFTEHPTVFLNDVYASSLDEFQALVKRLVSDYHGK